MENKTIHTCLNCGRSENEAPVIQIRFAGKTGYLCSQCIPVMIHKSEQMALKLKDLQS